MKTSNKKENFISLISSDLSPKTTEFYFERMNLRKRVIFFNVVKKDINEEQQELLLHYLKLDHSTLEEYNKNLEAFRYVLVGNIIDKHFYGEHKEIRRGNKQFRPGAKVYLLPEFGGDGHSKIPVWGLPRKSFRNIHIVLERTMMKNLRVKKTYDPILIEMIDDNFFYDEIGNDPSLLQRFADSINEDNKIHGREIVEAVQ